MTDEQANEILNELTTQMNNYGYGQILQQVTARQEEEANTNINESQINLKSQLKFYISNSIDILREMSVHQLPGIISRLNQYSSSYEPINQLQIELVNGRYFNLSELPDYRPVIRVLEDIQNLISQE
jgi:hypothetical protein